MRLASFITPLGAAVVAASGAFGSCSSNAPSASGQRRNPAALVASEAKPVMPCGAGNLPRIDERLLGKDGTRRLLDLSARGIVAVVWQEGRAEFVGDCRLPGRYDRIPGKGGAGQFRPSSRAIFATDEVVGECRRATHVVAAFATDGRADKPAATPPSRLQALLVPLPCPHVDDRQPAPGCVAKGLTGAQRLARSAERRRVTDLAVAHSGDVAKALEIFALEPDGSWGLSYAGALGEEGLSRQGRWLMSQYDLTTGDDPPQARPRDPSLRTPPEQPPWRAPDGRIVKAPVFLWCFPELVDPNVFFDVMY